MYKLGHSKRNTSTCAFQTRNINYGRACPDSKTWYTVRITAVSQDKFICRFSFVSVHNLIACVNVPKGITYYGSIRTRVYRAYTTRRESTSLKRARKWLYYFQKETTEVCHLWSVRLLPGQDHQSNYENPLLSAIKLLNPLNNNWSTLNYVYRQKENSYSRLPSIRN